jgi:membrane-associated phospholipid phosphatase
MRARGGVVGAVVLGFWISLSSSTTGSARAQASADEPSEARVPLAANFSVAERVTIVTAGVAGILAMAAAPYVVSPEPSLGAPAPGSLDRRISDELYRSTGTGRMLWRGPDIAGLYVLPYLPAVFYGGEALYNYRAGRPLFANGDLNADHRMWAYVEALAWTSLLTGVLKVAVGRARPYVVLDHPELEGPPREKNLSFYSGHSAAMFCAASFVALDVSDTLLAGKLRHAGPARRFLLGQLLPYVGALSVAGLVGVSRIIDQQHWASDVAVGAIVGTAAAHMSYVVHFDRLGRPRRRLGTDALGAPGALGLGPIPGGVAFRGLLP